MDKILEAASTQAPSLVVLVIVVWLFLKAQKDNRDSGNIERKEMVDRIDEIHRDHMNARTETRAVLEKVAGSMHELSLVVATVKTTMDRYNADYGRRD